LFAARLQVQGPQCRLQLALTDKQSLQVLLGMLPIPSLVQVDLNVPYLPEGAAALLAEGAALQTTAAASNSDHGEIDVAEEATSCQPPTSTDSTSTCSKREDADVTKQPNFSIGVWVCCWGGCTGINLSDALSIQQQLQSVGCGLYGIESVNCNSSSEVARMGSALAQLPGLKALGFNYRSSSSSNRKEQERTSITPASQAVAADANSTVGSSSSWQDNSNGCTSQAVGWLRDDATAALASLVPLQTSLQQLTIHGYPAGGFLQCSCSQCNNSSSEAPAAVNVNHISSRSSSCVANQAGGDAPAAERLERSCMQHPLAALTGLTKLQLLKQWTSKPLPVGPIAHLTGLVELAVERFTVQHARELECLSSLTRLTLLSLVLDVTADSLLEDVQQGQWQLVETAPAAAAVGGDAAQNLQVDDLERLLGELQVEQDFEPRQSAATAAAAEAAEEGTECSCSCCCFEAAAASASAGPPQADAAAAAAARDAALPQTTSSSCAADLWQQVMNCPCSAVSSPALLDWRWLRQLQQLQVAWLQVPHLDLACLPASLTELDVQQPHDLTSVSITCNSSSSNSSQSRLRLPSLKRLVLPRTLQVSWRTAAESHGMLVSAIEEVDVQAEDAAAAATGPDPVAADDKASHTSEDGSAHSEDDGAYTLLQLHHNAALLLELAIGCPELQEIEFVQWQLPPAAVLAAAQQLGYLKLLSLLQPDSKADEEALQQQLAGVRGGSVTLKLQEQLLLSSYPWSSVLAVR
jgi:hypothetical protein